jgi:uroporphyrinogen decarboxylase
MRQAGRYLPEYRKLRKTAGSFLDLCYTPELAEEVTMQPIRRFGFDAAILFSDILVVPHALGQRLEFREGEGPVLEPIDSVSELSRLKRDGAIERLAPIFETLMRVRDGLADDVALIGFCGAPWTVATYMVAGKGTPDQRDAKRWAYRDPAGFAELIALLVDISVEYLSRQADAGAQVLQIFDSWAGNLADDDFARWSIEPIAEIVKRVKSDHPAVPIIGFPRGAGPLYQDFILGTGVDAVSCDTSLPLPWIARKLQTAVTVQGNLDPVLLMAGGEAMERRIEAILQSLGTGPFVFNLGHGILPETPLEHVARLVELVRNWQPGEA